MPKWSEIHDLCPRTLSRPTKGGKNYNFEGSNTICGKNAHFRIFIAFSPPFHPQKTVADLLARRDESNGILIRLKTLSKTYYFEGVEGSWAVSGKSRQISHHVGPLNIMDLFSVFWFLSVRTDSSSSDLSLCPWRHPQTRRISILIMYVEARPCVNSFFKPVNSLIVNSVNNQKSVNSLTGFVNP